MTIGTQQNKIFNLGIVSFLCSVNEGLEVSLTLLRYFQSYSKGLAGLCPAILLACVEFTIRIAAMISSFGGVCPRSFRNALLDRGVIAFQLGSKVAVSLSRCNQTVCGCSVFRSVCRLKYDFLVVIQSQPMETFNDRTR